MTQDTLATAISVGIRILSMRVLVILALLLDAGLFGWALVAGGWDRYAAATTFAVVVWFTLNVSYRKE